VEAGDIQDAQPDSLPDSRAEKAHAMPQFFNTIVPESEESKAPTLQRLSSERSNLTAAASTGGMSGKSMRSPSERSMVSMKSLRRSTSVYSDFQAPDRDLQSTGVRETKMLRAGSVKNTGVFVNQYAVIKNLGSGSFGKVKLAMDTVTGELVAIKVVMRAEKNRKRMMMRRATSGMQMPEDPDEQFKKEILVMKKLYHPNVVQLIEVIDDPQERKLMLVMEYVDGGVVDCKHPMSEEKARKYFQDAAKGLYYLHQNSIVHGDLKPDNMLLSDEEGLVKLTDFGSSSMFEKGDTETMNKTNGTPAFMCPEMCAAQPYRGRVADCWALAVCLWNMVHASLPFQGATVMALYEAIRDREPQFPKNIQISDSLRDLLTRSLKKDPEERLSLRDMLVHPWTTDDGKHTLVDMDEQLDAYDLADVAKKVAIQEITTLLRDFPRKEYREGEYVFMAGFDANEMFFLEEGECEVILRPQDREWLQCDQMALGSAHVPSDSDESEESDSDDDMDMPNEQEDGIVLPGENKAKPAWAVSKFSDSTYQMVKSVSGSLHRHMSKRAEGNGEELLGRKFAGHFVGTVGMPGRAETGKHTVTVRARNHVRAVQITAEAADKFIAENPDTSDPLRKAMGKRDVEHQVYNVMARLSTLHKNIQDTERRRTGVFSEALLPEELAHAQILRTDNGEDDDDTIEES